MTELRQQKISLEKLRMLRVPVLPDHDVQMSTTESIHKEFDRISESEHQLLCLKAQADDELCATLGVEDRSELVTA